MVENYGGQNRIYIHSPQLSDPSLPWSENNILKTPGTKMSQIGNDGLKRVVAIDSCRGAWLMPA